MGTGKSFARRNVALINIDQRCGGLSGKRRGGLHTLHGQSRGLRGARGDVGAIPIGLLPVWHHSFRVPTFWLPRSQVAPTTIWGGALGQPVSAAPQKSVIHGKLPVTRVDADRLTIVSDGIVSDEIVSSEIVSDEIASDEIASDEIASSGIASGSGWKCRVGAQSAANVANCQILQRKYFMYV
jgi:hypothetical protein